MTSTDRPDEPYVTVADVEVTAVRPAVSGFVLEGRGRDRADYRLELHLDFPVDARTRRVLGELLAQSEWRISRRAAREPFRRLRPDTSRKSAR